ncbi:hypothetical protein GALMADRAFT_221816 [Galerina marginata CBS 339.88]|uniref:NADP-dependent oxidoreductase domain-containing protein n=1 Tax=Galerina marginata (strain CBS 339.88) TaxID=685588 RepID=A0A067TI02_GALM3|nr:hypothetical protein GALMADRAFT_221816 [Galerina marginata CBS 339.88]
MSWNFRLSGISYPWPGQKEWPLHLGMFSQAEKFEQTRKRKSAVKPEKGRTTFDPTWERTEKERLVCKALEKVANEVGAKDITSDWCFVFLQNFLCLFSCSRLVAIAYLMQKTTYVFPIIGGRKVEHLLSNIEALDISLTDEQIKPLGSPDSSPSPVIPRSHLSQPGPKF